MEIRRNKCYLVVGKKFTGKTTVSQAIAKASGKKQCIVDTDEHPAYDEFTLLHESRLKQWRSGNIKIITSDPQNVLTILNKECSNAFIICEDAAKYIEANVGKNVRAFIIDHRKRNFDILLMFHFLGDVPPYVAKQYDHMILFKTGDNLNVSQPKFKNWHKITEKAERINRHKDIHYCEKIDMDE